MHENATTVTALRRPTGRLAAGVLLASLALLASSCSSEQTAAAQIGISPEAFTKIVEGEEDFLSPASERRIEAWIGYADGDQVVRISNGGLVELGDLDIAFRISPYPPTQFDEVVTLTFTDHAGNPVEVQVDAWYDMIFMTHGQPTVDVESLGEGRYRFPLDLFMFGPWVLKATVQSPTASGPLPLLIYVWP